MAGHEKAPHSQATLKEGASIERRHKSIAQKVFKREACQSGYWGKSNIRALCKLEACERHKQVMEGLTKGGELMWVKLQDSSSTLRCNNVLFQVKDVRKTPHQMVLDVGQHLDRRMVLLNWWKILNKMEGIRDEINDV